MHNVALSATEQVQAVQEWLLEQPQIKIETRHYFAGGIYEREIIVPAGAMIAGKIHLYEHLAKLSKGTMTIFSEHSKGTFTGPKTFVSRPGEKRLGYAHDDCVFSTFHKVGSGATEADVPVLEAHLVVDTIQEYLKITEQGKCNVICSGS